MKDKADFTDFSYASIDVLGRHATPRPQQEFGFQLLAAARCLRVGVMLVPNEWDGYNYGNDDFIHTAGLKMCWRSDDQTINWP